MRTIIFPHRLQSTNDPIVRSAFDQVERRKELQRVGASSAVSHLVFPQIFLNLSKKLHGFYRTTDERPFDYAERKKNPASRFLFKEVYFFKET